MRYVLVLLVTVLFSAASLNADTVGESPLAGGGTPDGWSGISVLSDGYGGLPAGQSVSTFNYYAADGRAAGENNVQALIAKQEGDVYTIWEVGPIGTPDGAGEYSIDWGSSIVPDDGNSYHPAIWQWRTGHDDANGGLVPFNGSGGSGMFQQNQNGAEYVPEVGNELYPAGQQHSSGGGGRAYQFNFETVVPEPSTAMLAALALIPILCMRRKRK